MANILKHVSLHISQKQIENLKQIEEETKTDKFAELNLGFPVFLVYLFICFVLSVFELLLFSWRNKGSNTIWVALVKQVKTAAKKEEKVTKEEVVEGEESKPEHWLLGPDNVKNESTRI